MLNVSEFTIHKNEYLQYSEIINCLYGFELETDLQNLASELIDGEYIAMNKFEPDVMCLLEDNQIGAYWKKHTDYEGILFISGVLRGLLVKIVHKIGAVFVYWSKLVHK